MFNNKVFLRYILAAIMVFTILPGLQVQAADGPNLPLAEQVAALKLGFGSYFLGETLTPEQLELAGKNLMDDAYQGTYKFMDGDVAVVADQMSNLILASYKQKSQVNRNEMKELVGRLMLQFGEPTTMAHSKIIYWAFGPEGLIPENEYLSAKETGMISILGTVKMSSSTEIIPDEPKADSSEQPEAVATAANPEVYIMISSDPLIKEFMAK